MLPIVLRGDVAASEREYLSVLDLTPSEADRRTARHRLGLLYLTQGRFEKAREQVQASTAEGTTNFWMGWVELEASRPDLAIVRGHGRHRHTKHLDGRTAIADLEWAGSMLPHQLNPSDEHAAILDLLAGGYTVAGDLAKARETYEKITALTTARQAFGATYARSFYHLGLIAEHQGDKARAREQFQKFLELWKDANKGLPELADARKRIAQ